MENEIPPITDAMGAYWVQPPREAILVDEKHALMDLETFLGLSEYTVTVPTLLYEGKMWRSFQDGVWYVCWCKEVPSPVRDAATVLRERRVRTEEEREDEIEIHSRSILLTDAELPRRNTIPHPIPDTLRGK